MISQTILPVVSYNMQYLGWLTMDSAHLFTGSETSWVVATMTVPIQFYGFKRSSDQVQVNFMGMPISQLQLQAGNWKNLIPVSAWNDISTGTAYPQWFMTGAVSTAPADTAAPQISTLANFLASASF